MLNARSLTFVNMKPCKTIYLSVHAKVLDQPDEHGGCPVVCPLQQEAIRHTGPGLQTHGLHGSVHRVHGHGPVGGPLAPGDGDQLGVRHVDHVVPHQTRRVSGFRILHKGSDARPSRQYVASSHIDIWSQIVLDLGQYKLDVLLTRTRTCCHWTWGVCCPSYGVTFPGQEEDNSSITCGWIKETHVRWRIIIRKYDVDTSRWTDNVPRLAVIHLPDGVSEWPGGVDDTLGLDDKLLPCDPVPGLGSRDDSICFDQIQNLDMVGDGNCSAWMGSTLCLGTSNVITISLHLKERDEPHTAFIIVVLRFSRIRAGSWATHAPYKDRGHTMAATSWARTRMGNGAH